MNLESNITISEETKKRGILITILTFLILLMGTFAWQAFNQEALNVTEGTAANPGGRLHDDFDGTNKSVYVENFMDVRLGGDDIYVRVRLDEYLEFYDTNIEGTRILRSDIRKSEDMPQKDKTETWDTYEFQTYAYSLPSELCVRNYRDITFAGRGDYTYYLPTFNMDNMDLDADINGTIEGDNGGGPGTGDKSDPYNDYVKYTPDNFPDGVTGTEVYLYNEEIDYERVFGHTVTPGSDGLFARADITHDIQKTQVITKDVISMEDWLELDYEDQIGDYWVYDVDGWAYYAAGISYQSASGSLVKNIEVLDNPVGDWYYGVNVVSQMASAGDWGRAATETEPAAGMYEDGITDDALVFLNTVSGILRVLKLELLCDGEGIKRDLLELGLGEWFDFSVDMQVLNGEGSDTNEDVIWLVEEISETKSGLADYSINARLVDGRFLPTLSMVGCTYRITATSALNTSLSDSVEVEVFRLDGITLTAVAANDWELVQPGEKVASVALFTGYSANTNVIWSMTGANHEDTVIDENTGLITVSEEEETGGVLTITAVSEAFSSITDSYELDVRTLVDLNTNEYLLNVGFCDYRETFEFAGMIWYPLDEAELNGRSAVLVMSETPIQITSTIASGYTVAPRMTTTTSAVLGSESGRWSLTNMRNIYLPEWVMNNGGETLKNQIASVWNESVDYFHEGHQANPIETVTSLTSDYVKDQAFIISVPEIYKYFYGQGSDAQHILRGGSVSATTGGGLAYHWTRSINASDSTTTAFEVYRTAVTGSTAIGYTASAHSSAWNETPSYYIGNGYGFNPMMWLYI